MFANGPPWTKTGLCSRLCTRLGAKASRNSAARAPAASRSPQVTGRPSRSRATTIAASRRSRSARSRARQNTAMTSEATVMSKPSSRTGPLAASSPVTTWRSARSLRSTTRRQPIVAGSMPSALPQWRWLSTSAARRLLAEPIACRSPVKWRLIRSIGITCARPPPAAPPFMPKHGPSDGSRRHETARRPMRFSASPRPTVVVVFPSPAGVGVIAVTRTSRPRGAPAASGSTLATSRP